MAGGRGRVPEGAGVGADHGIGEDRAGDGAEPEEALNPFDSLASLGRSGHARGSLKAAIFDFDGLILGTEETQLSAWQAIYREHGVELHLKDWSICIGTAGAFDEVTHLEKLTGRSVDRTGLRADFKGREAALLAQLELLPGVRDRLEEAVAAGIRRAIASSSTSDWVEPRLADHNIRHLFEAVVVRNETLPAKPRPDIYLAALEALGVRAGEAVAFEDSMNGILAAKAAGIYCVAVPNPVTRDLDLSAADRRVESLAHLTLAELARTVFGNGGRE